MKLKVKAWDGKKFLDLQKLTPLALSDPEMKGLFIPDIPHLKIIFWTGEYDKYGREIYEGDIIPSLNNQGNHEVIFGNGAFLWAGELLGYSYDTDKPIEPYPTDKWAEVIGNKFENPELLTP